MLLILSTYNEHIVFFITGKYIFSTSRYIGIRLAGHSSTKQKRMYDKKGKKADEETSLIYILLKNSREVMLY